MNSLSKNKQKRSKSKKIMTLSALFPLQESLYLTLYSLNLVPINNVNVNIKYVQQEKKTTNRLKKGTLFRTFHPGPTRIP